MARRSGLGKGLGALIPPNPVTSGGSMLREVPLARIRPNPYQPRNQFGEQGLSALVDSIKSVGILQPVLVREVGTGGIRADRRRAPFPSRPPSRPPVDTGTRPPSRRRHEPRGGSGGEPASRGPQPARRSRRLSAADRGVQSDPRGGGAQGRPLQDRRDQRAPSFPAASDSAAICARRTTERRARPDAAGDARPDRPGTPCRRSRSERRVGRVLEEQVRAAVRETQVEEGAGEVGTTNGAAATGETGTGAPRSGRSLRPPGVHDLEELLEDRLNTRVKVDMGGKRGKLVIEFATLDDLERIYRVIIGETST